ncbi:MAG TPA: hypothetical protein VEQ60_11855 [Longimicrobium sp.]|nr:hypothetical protein [Longimicrobium sp.]
MSTPARYAQAVAQLTTDAPSTSTALVPIVRDRETPPAPPPAAGIPTNAHRLFYGAGYFGLILVWVSVWLHPFTGWRFQPVGLFGGVFIAVGGFGILIHTLYKPNGRKMRHLLLALAALALTLAAGPLVLRVGREVYATAAMSRLQPLAEAIAEDARIREIGVLDARVLLNGYSGPEQGPGGAIEGQTGEHLLDDVLARDGISRDEYLAYQRSLREMGMQRAQRTPSTVAFYPDGPSGPWLLYVQPGHALPPAHALLDDTGTYYSEPLGGPWYMVLNGRR